MNGKALGLIETIGFIPAVEAADVAVKSANVELDGFIYTGAGLVTVVMTGDMSSVKASVEAGKSAAGRIGKVSSDSVIARTADGLEEILVQKGQGSNEKKKLLLKSCEQLQESEESKEAVVDKAGKSDADKAGGDDVDKAGKSDADKIDDGDSEKTGEETTEVKLAPSCDLNTLKSMNVSKLRDIARHLDDFSIPLEKIKNAGKKELVKAILQYYGQK